MRISLLRRQSAALFLALVMMFAYIITIPSQAAVNSEWDLDLPSLKEQYEDYFLVGNITQNANNRNTERYVQHFKHQYGITTFENAMKPNALYPSSNPGASGTWNFRFTTVDPFITWAGENDLKVHGHVLVWHSQNPNWLSNALGNRANAKIYMEKAVTGIVGHFKDVNDVLSSWDVVNEAFIDGVEAPFENWRDVLRTSSPWYVAYNNGANAEEGESGADYIYDAFVFARLTDPGITLYYNDFNDDQYWKAEAWAQMTEELNAKWLEDPRNEDPERLLIEGIGFQSHYWTRNIHIGVLERTFQRFADLGLEISVSELDIPFGEYTSGYSNGIRPNPNTEYVDNQQAEQYAKLFLLYKKYSEYINHVIFWGNSTDVAWRRDAIFDGQGKARKPFYAALNPEDFVGQSYKDFIDDKTGAYYIEDGLFYFKYPKGADTSEVTITIGGKEYPFTVEEVTGNLIVDITEEVPLSLFDPNGTSMLDRLGYNAYVEKYLRENVFGKISLNYPGKKTDNFDFGYGCKFSDDPGNSWDIIGGDISKDDINVIFRDDGKVDVKPVNEELSLEGIILVFKGITYPDHPEYSQYVFTLAVGM